MAENKVFTGIVTTEQGPIVFQGEDKNFVFRFMDTVQIKREESSYRMIHIPTEDSFVFGKTHDNRDIAVYCGNNTLEIIGTQKVTTNSFFVSKGILENTDLRQFDGITFVGKSLNKIFDINGITVNYEGDGEKIVHNNDTLSYDVSTDDYHFVLSIRSCVSYHGGFSGMGIENKDVSLTLEFDSLQPLSSFYYHYNRICDIVGFLLNRFEVGFDKISLLRYNEELHMRSEFASVFIRDDSSITTREKYEILSFNDLGDTVPELVKLFYQNTEGKHTCSLGFYPDNDDRLYYMTNDRVKSICSGLECELSFNKDIETENNPNLLELIEQTKSLIKSYRKDNPDAISDNTYSMIFSSLSHWSYSLAERIWSLYCKFYPEMSILNCFHHLHIQKAHIQQFVKYRNDITHGNHRVLNHDVSKTAHTLSGLVYCSILNRIGLDHEAICKLCDEKLLT